MISISAPSTIPSEEQPGADGPTAQAEIQAPVEQPSKQPTRSKPTPEELRRRASIGGKKRAANAAVAREMEQASGYPESYKSFAEFAAIPLSKHGDRLRYESALMATEIAKEIRALRKANDPTNKTEIARLTVQFGILYDKATSKAQDNTGPIHIPDRFLNVLQDLYRTEWKVKTGVLPDGWAPKEGDTPAPIIEGETVEHKGA